MSKMDTVSEPHPEEGCSVSGHPQDFEETFTPVIPKELETPEAKKILARLQKKGILDEDLQPSKLVGWQKGVLAFELGERLNIRYRWKVMCTFWGCNVGTVRSNYSKKFGTEKCIEFTKKIKALLY